MEEQIRHLMDWSQWGRQWVEHLRTKKPLHRELERHLHKFDETFTSIGRQAARLDKGRVQEMLPLLVAQAQKVQEQFHKFLRLVEQHEQDTPEPKPASYPPAGEPGFRRVSERVPVGRPVPAGGHSLPPLPYDYNALEPHIDEETMRIHHATLHKKYVDDLNKAELELEKARSNGNFELIRHWERELAFNGAGHYLHTIFFSAMSPQGGGEPGAELAAAISAYFGSFQTFKQQFSQAAEKVEGPGWAILVWSPRAQRLELLTAEKHQNLSQWDVVPLLPLDVWEHSYFLKYKSKRADYIKAWWNVVNWPYVEERYRQARRLRWQPF
ncbi:superoxide dismutase [Brevibacillus sp. TJ4]|uniref:superoxide dismutase n=1 Tax=Brevibacillus sp. TJ4 TaxID=3234853 RepID=UPI0037D2009B